MGISVQDITEDMAKSLQLKDRGGAMISEAFKGDPAERAGIRAGDIVTEVNGKKIKDTHDLLLTIAALHVGDRVQVKVIRDGKEMTFQVTVTERRERAEIAASGSQDDFGIEAQEITPEISRYLGIPLKSGVVVVGVAEGSIADEAGIQPQDVILQINRMKVTSLKEFNREMTSKNSKNGVMLLIKRGQATFFIALRR
jgi:serine protease Do